MNYASAMQSVLKFDESVYPAIMDEKKTARYCMINVMFFGIIHALFSLHFSGRLMAESQMIEGLPLISKAVVILTGAAVAFLLHAGGAMFLWVFSRGIGGNTAFLPVYFNLGISFIGLWPLAPVMAAFQAGLGGAGLNLILGIAIVYGLAVILFGTKSASGLSLIKMLAAMFITIVGAASFLYIWL